jgi:hypothetical protein
VRDSKPGHRPPRVYRALIEELSARALREMWAVVSDPEHPWHAEHGPKMLRDLVRICTPRLGHVEIFRANDVTDLLDPQPSIAELFESAGNDFDTQKPPGCASDPPA